MKNSHYVPKFILKKFSDKICLYNVKEEKFEENIKVEKAYCTMGFYDDDIEDKLNKKLESRFSRLLNDKILKGQDKIELSKEELLLVKKFLLISIIRSIGSEDLIQAEKRYYDDLVSLLKVTDCIKNKEDENRIRPFIEKDIPNETNREYWMRTIDVILDTNGSPKEILEHPKKTYPAYRWSLVVSAGYLAFWDSNYERDEFVITDIGMTSENEIGWDEVTNYNTKKINYLLKLLKNETNETMKNEILKQIEFIVSFHENFQIYSISARRMIVLISPFYRFRDVYKSIYSMPKLENLTKLINEKLFLPNDVHYVNPPKDGKLIYDSDDKYIYNINQLSRDETRYCNALFLDRIDTTLGFSSLSKAVGSILYYKKITKYPIVPRVKYDKLYEIITDIYQKGIK